MLWDELFRGTTHVPVIKSYNRLFLICNVDIRSELLTRFHSDCSGEKFPYMRYPVELPADDSSSLKGLS